MWVINLSARIYKQNCMETLDIFNLTIFSLLRFLLAETSDKIDELIIRLNMKMGSSNCFLFRVIRNLQECWGQMGQLFCLLSSAVPVLDLASSTAPTVKNNALSEVTFCWNWNYTVAVEQWAETNLWIINDSMFGY
jgi:hypothetical protein